MKAIVYTKYGNADVLQLKEVDKPSPRDDEVLVKIHAVSINDWDWAMINGGFICRLMNGLFRPRKKILGSDIAGKIEAVGKNIKKYQPGDEVFGDLSGQWGGFAEYVCAKEKALALKPASMSFEEAASIPQAGLLAVQALIDKGHIQNGQKILINGAGGGVGTLGIQVAKTFDVEITGVDSGLKLDMMRSIGFDHVIDYTKEDFTKSGLRYDLIVDTKTNRSMLAYTRALSARGTYVTVGGSIRRLLFDLFILRPWISLFTKKHIRLVPLKLNKDLEYMKELFLAGKLKPVIDGPYPLAEVPGAFSHFEKGEHKGKIVITI